VKRTQHHQDRGTRQDSFEENLDERTATVTGTAVTPGYTPVMATENLLVTSAVVNNEHRTNLGKELKKLRAEVKSIVKFTMFRTVKFLLTDAQLAWNNPQFAKPIMDRLGLEGDVNRMRTWSDCKQIANFALRERRAAVNAAVKHGVIGK
jgi:hypothetical protein